MNLLQEQCESTDCTPNNLIPVQQCSVTAGLLNLNFSTFSESRTNGHLSRNFFLKDAELLNPSPTRFIESKAGWPAKNPGVGWILQADSDIFGRFGGPIAFLTVRRHGYFFGNEKSKSHPSKITLTFDKDEWLGAPGLYYLLAFFSAKPHQ